VTGLLDQSRSVDYGRGRRSKCGRGHTALTIATLSVFLARYSNSGSVNHCKFLQGRAVTISDVVDMERHGHGVAEASFIHKDTLTYVLLKLRNTTWITGALSCLKIYLYVLDVLHAVHKNS